MASLGRASRRDRAAAQLRARSPRSTMPSCSSRHRGAAHVPVDAVEHVLEQVVQVRARARLVAPSRARSTPPRTRRTQIDRLRPLVAVLDAAPRPGLAVRGIHADVARRERRCSSSRSGSSDASRSHRERRSEDARCESGFGLAITGEVLCPDLPTRTMYARSGRGSESGTLRRMSPRVSSPQLVLGAVTRDVEPGERDCAGRRGALRGPRLRGARRAHARVVTRGAARRRRTSSWPSCARRESRRARWPSRGDHRPTRTTAAAARTCTSCCQPRTRSPGRSARWTGGAPNAIHLGPLHRRDLAPGDAQPCCEGPGRHRPAGARAALLADGTRLAPNPALKDFCARLGREGGRGGDRGAARGRTLEEFRREFDVAELLVTRGARGALLVTRSGVDEIAARSRARAASRPAPATCSSPPICSRARAVASRARQPASSPRARAPAQIERGLRVPSEPRARVPAVTPGSRCCAAACSSRACGTTRQTLPTATRSSTRVPVPNAYKADAAPELDRRRDRRLPARAGARPEPRTARRTRHWFTLGAEPLVHGVRLGRQLVPGDEVELPRGLAADHARAAKR